MTDKRALKLFMLRHGKGGAVDKQLAKQARQEGHVVSFGIDHNKYKPRKEDI